MCEQCGAHAASSGSADEQFAVSVCLSCSARSVGKERSAPSVVAARHPSQRSTRTVRDASWREAADARAACGQAWARRAAARPLGLSSVVRGLVRLVRLLRLALVDARSRLPLRLLATAAVVVSAVGAGQGAALETSAARCIRTALILHSQRRTPLPDRGAEGRAGSTLRTDSETSHQLVSAQ